MSAQEMCTQPEEEKHIFGHFSKAVEKFGRWNAMAGGNQQPFLQDANIGKPLEEFVKSTQRGGPRAIYEEYKIVLAVSKDDQQSQKCDENQQLNRWDYVRCFEHTRVQLGPPRDYIHANYVDGFRHPKKFICTQGPLRTTIDDFWRMVWQEKTVLVIALTKVGGPKCELYFPDQVGIALEAGHIKVQNQQIKHIRNTYNKCVFQISKDGQQRRRVVQLLYHAWPDGGTPDSSTEFLNFMEHYRNLQIELTNKLRSEKQWTDKNFGPPIVVHCSAGVGRTGTLCALDVITERMKWTKEVSGVPLVSIGKTVTTIRSQRHLAVQSAEQYMFLYLAVLVYALKYDLIAPEKIDISAFVPQ